MKLKHLDISPARLEAFCRRWGVQELALFGSVLREDFRPESDVDILITLRPGDRLSLDNRAAMLDELADIFGRKVDLVEKRHIRNPFRRQAILTSKKVVYAA